MIIIIMISASAAAAAVTPRTREGLEELPHAIIKACSRLAIAPTATANSTAAVAQEAS
jgi:hypothetical protein